MLLMRIELMTFSLQEKELPLQLSVGKLKKGPSLTRETLCH